MTRDTRDKREKKLDISSGIELVQSLMVWVIYVVNVDVDEPAITCKGSCSDAGEVFGFLDKGAASGVLSEVVGKSIITLSRDSVLLSV